MKFSFKQILLISTTAVLTKFSWAQNPKLKGTVFSEEDGKPLPGVTIAIKAKGISIQSSSAGEFSLDATKGDLVVFTSMGYLQQVLVIGNKLTLEVFLKNDIRKLSEVVIVGYGTQKKSSLTGAVASVSNVEMQKLTVGSLGAAIQGRTPGVTVITDGGVAGSGVNILIRGTGSLTNIAPLYVIDGTFASSLDGVNSSDIESMEILKDAAAAAIYGSRAANGVVLITTKKGKEGVVKINLNSSYGEQTLSKRLSFLNASQYVGLMKQVAASDGVAVPSRITNFNPYLNQDYQSLWFGNAPIYNIGLNMEGGQKNSSFYSSLNYLDQKSILAFSDFKRYDFKLNTSQKINRLKLEEYISINRTERHPNYTYSGVAYGFDIPILPAKNLIPAFWGDHSNGYASALQSQYFITNPPSIPNPTFTTSNMLATGALSSFVENETIFTGSMKVGYELFRGLVYSFGLNGFYQVSNSDYNIPNFTLLDVDGLHPQIQNRSYTGSNGSYFQYSMDNLLSYKKNIRRHDFDMLFGQSWMQETSTTITNIAGPSNFVSNAIALPQGALSTSSNQYGSALLSIFGRINYDYDNRYLLSASARSDASSKFAGSSRVGLFPSISVGWNIQNEHFFKSKLISLAKLRASYGELGANFIPPYSFVSTIRATVPVALGDQSRGMGTITQTANPYLKWETAQSYNYGFDLGLLNNKFTLTAEYFQKKYINLLASLTPPPSAGMGLDYNTPQNSDHRVS